MGSVPSFFIASAFRHSKARPESLTKENSYRNIIRQNSTYSFFILFAKTYSYREGIGVKCDEFIDVITGDVKRDSRSDCHSRRR